MKIVTLTLNPAIDKSATIQNLAPDKKLRTSNIKFEPGGGGINVSRAIKKLDGSSLTLFASGGHTGEFLNQLVQEEALNYQQIQVQDITRENLMIYDESADNQYRFGMLGASFTDEEAQNCLDLIKSLDPAPEYLVASGSLPPGLPDDFYAEIGKAAREIGCKYVLDTSGAALKEGVKNGTHLLKPNLGELSRLTGKDSLEGEMVEKAARQLLDKDQCEVVAVSLGPGGALLVTPEKVEQIPSPTVHKQSTVGAGDSMVAGMVLSLARGEDFRCMIRYGVACGTAATITPGSELCRKEDVDKLYKWILNTCPVD